ncbi:hypothetical protein AGOR_G00196010 [Albula goreensis]|uniref:Ig-like domain-containing protein n=1 Tax=Albula goreensis TaxID=1534307 RepID=A0A8T3CMY6_9TELE|nr:hypothetical protein AGOR_G00196010 [Albula goreensis]
MLSLRQAALALGLCSVLSQTWAIVLERPILEDFNTSLINSVAVLNCYLPSPPENETIQYELFKGTKSLGEYSAQHGEKGVFNLWVKDLSYDGNISCKASVQNNTDVKATESDTQSFRVIVPVEGAELRSNPSSGEVFEGRGLSLNCTLKQGTYVSYEWFLNGDSLNQSTELLVVQYVTLQDAGNYSCEARNEAYDPDEEMTMIYSTSSHRLVKVKAPVSKPNISFTVQREGDDYWAIVTCQSGRGTPPVTFSFHNQTLADLVSNETASLQATVRIPIILGQNMGEVQCKATNGGDLAVSDAMTLEVVPVGGVAKVRLEYEMGSYGKVLLHCDLERGTFPEIHWFLNGTELDSRGQFHKIQEQALKLTSITPSSTGFYHCEARDSFGTEKRIISEKKIIDRTVLDRVSVLAFAIVLSCLLFLMVLVTACCLYGAIHRRRLTPAKPRPIVLTEVVSMEDEDEEPEATEYMEDVELVEAAKIEDKDTSLTGEEGSVDEWPEIEKALQVNFMDEEPI